MTMYWYTSRCKYCCNRVRATQVLSKVVSIVTTSAHRMQTIHSLRNPMDGAAATKASLTTASRSVLLATPPHQHTGAYTLAPLTPLLPLVSTDPVSFLRSLVKDWTTLGSTERICTAYTTTSLNFYQMTLGTDLRSACPTTSLQVK